MNLHITTPLERRSLTSAQIVAQTRAAACSLDTIVNEWAVVCRIAVATDCIGVSDHSLSVLNVLLSFHPETALIPGVQSETPDPLSSPGLWAATRTRSHIGKLTSTIRLRQPRSSCWSATCCAS